jgi:hypothetical protein
METNLNLGDKLYLKDKKVIKKVVWKNDDYMASLYDSSMIELASMKPLPFYKFIREQPTYLVKFKGKELVIPVFEFIHRCRKLRSHKHKERCSVEYARPTEYDKIHKYHSLRYKYARDVHIRNYMSRYMGKACTIDELIEFVESGRTFMIRDQFFKDNFLPSDANMKFALKKAVEDKIENIAEETANGVISRMKIPRVSDEFVANLINEVSNVGISYITSVAYDLHEKLIEKVVNHANEDKAWAIKYLLSFVDGTKSNAMKKRRNDKKVENIADAIILQHNENKSK